MLRSTPPALLELRSNQVPPRLTPMLAVPLPSQSPTTGWSVAAPYAKGGTVAGLAGSLLVRRNQVVPRTTPGLSVPSPFQSPATGRSEP
jgi:hypothetical protein